MPDRRDGPGPAPVAVSPVSVPPAADPPAAVSGAPGWHLAYGALVHAATPFALARLWWKGRAAPGYRERIGERFGHVPAVAGGVDVWVHAVSVGEAIAAEPLIRALVARHGARRVWVTSTTPTGSAQVRRLFGEGVGHSFVPYDLPGALARFLDRVRPRLLVVMETELWPNLFQAVRARGVPLAIVNARLSPRSFRGYGRVGGFAAAVLGDVSLVAAQSTDDAGRFTSLGAPRVVDAGNMKFDIAPPPAAVAVGRGWRARLEVGEAPAPAARAHPRPRPAWIAASTHEGEEAAALAAHAAVRRTHPEALLWLVPRHPERFDRVTALARQAGFAVDRRSRWGVGADADPGDTAGREPDVIVGDSLGEMWSYLAASDVAFVGGSLVPVGGHNLLEPAALALPVLSGPSLHNFRAAEQALVSTGGLRLVADAEALGRQVSELLADAAGRLAMGRAAAAALGQGQGAVARTLALVEELLAAAPPGVEP